MAQSVPRYETEFVQLRDWMTVEDTATKLGISSARVRQLIADKRFKTIALVGSRPVNLLSVKEVDAMLRAQQQRNSAAGR